MRGEVDRALRTGDTVGGVFEVVAHGVPPGIGTHINWDERLDGLLAQAVMSLQAVKAVEIGRGVTAAESMGSTVHDTISYASEEEQATASTRFTRETNNAGGMEGGISNGQTSPSAATSSHLHPPPPPRLRPSKPANLSKPPTSAATSASSPQPESPQNPWSPSPSPASCSISSVATASGETTRNLEGYRQQIRTF